MNWFTRIKEGIQTRIRRDVAEEVWSKCKSCGHPEPKATLERNLNICSACGHHNAIGHEKYVDLLIDAGTFEELDANLTAVDPLKFKDTKRYTDRLKDAKKASSMNEGIYTGVGRLGGHPVAIGVMDTRFILGSLGGATGEKIARLIDRAVADRRTLILVCQSAGARMMESAYSLMQLAKISAKLRQLSDAGLLYITVLTDPTYGGTTASFGMLGDVILSEPDARVGFAGPAVIKQFLGIDELPQGFQLAETVLEHGFVDRIVTRDEMAATLANLIALIAPTAESSTELSTAAG